VSTPTTFVNAICQVVAFDLAICGHLEQCERGDARLPPRFVEPPNAEQQQSSPGPARRSDGAGRDESQPALASPSITSESLPTALLRRYSISSTASAPDQPRFDLKPAEQTRACGRPFMGRLSSQAFPNPPSTVCTLESLFLPTERGRPFDRSVEHRRVTAGSHIPLFWADSRRPADHRAA
jgi:hypothetical protein